MILSLCSNKLKAANAEALLFQEALSIVKATLQAVYCFTSNSSRTLMKEALFLVFAVVQVMPSFCQL
jgi:hypothetical protein